MMITSYHTARPSMRSASRIATTKSKRITRNKGRYWRRYTLLQFSLLSGVLRLQRFPEKVKLQCWWGMILLIMSAKNRVSFKVWYVPQILVYLVSHHQAFAFDSFDMKGVMHTAQRAGCRKLKRSSCRVVPLVASAHTSCANLYSDHSLISRRAGVRFILAQTSLRLQNPRMEADPRDVCSDIDAYPNHGCCAH